MGVISDLMSDRGWTMDDSLHEMTHIRHDLPSWLQLRPRVQKSPASIQSHRIVRTLANQKEKVNPRQVLQRAKARSSGSQRSRKVPIGSNCACDTKRGLVNWVIRANTPVCVHTQ